MTLAGGTNDEVKREQKYTNQVALTPRGGTIRHKPCCMKRRSLIRIYPSPAAYGQNLPI